MPVEVTAGWVVTATATNRDSTSEFSAAVVVTPDLDGDGVLDSIEDAGSNGGDANNDGTPDKDQPTVASLPNALDGRYVVLESDGPDFRHVQASANPSAHTTPPGVDFPVGFFSLQLAALPNATGHITWSLPSGETADTMYGYGPTPDQTTDHSYQFLDDGVTGVVQTGQQIKAHFVDGNFVGNSRGDHDLELNGIVQLLVAPGVIDPTIGITLIVNTDSDVDDGDLNELSFREAILQSNLLPGRDLIAFNIPGLGPHAIQVTSELPHLTDAVVIDGYTQSGAVPTDGETPAQLMIAIDGHMVGSFIDGDGLTLIAGNSTVRGLSIYGFERDQVLVTGLDGNVVEGNWIGLDPTGAPFPNQYIGIEVFESSNNVIGGTTPAARNVISGHLTGVNIVSYWFDPEFTANNRVTGNFIGTDPGGTMPIGNGFGIDVHETTGTRIGGSEPGEWNLISGNGQYGIRLAGTRTDLDGTLVQGNLIGVDAAVEGTLANLSGGIVVIAPNAQIGGTTSAAGNVISGNEGPGIYLFTDPELGEGSVVNTTIQGNWIGTDPAGRHLGNNGPGIWISDFSNSISETHVGGVASGAGNMIAFNNGSGVIVQGQTTGHAILSNAIYGNRDLGIDLGFDGPTPNDFGDFDVGPNDLQNFPQLMVTVTSSGIRAEGTLEAGIPQADYRLEFFLEDSQSQTLLGALNVQTDFTGRADFSQDFSVPWSIDTRVVATATDAQGNTSEFGPGFVPDPAGLLLDYGDAFMPGTLSFEDGARHIITGSLRLGSLIDFEAEAWKSPLADGDDTHASDDDDGVRFLTPLVTGEIAVIEVTVSETAFLDAWIDVNGDGLWGPTFSGEQILVGQQLRPGRNLLTITVPNVFGPLPSGPVAARFRVSSRGELLPFGLAADGEVEDYVVTIEEPNRAPFALPDNAITPADTEVVVDVLSNDSDPDGGIVSQSLALTQEPEHGFVEINPVTHTFIYIPAPGFSGPDSFSYQVSDNEGATATAPVLVLVLPPNQPPQVIDDDATTSEDRSVVIDLPANDTDVDGLLDISSLRVVVPP